MFGVFLAAAALLLVAAPARAQGGFIHGLGGVTFGTEVGPVFGGGGGIAVGERLQIFGEFGRMGNVFPADLQDDLDDLSDFLSEQTGQSVTFDVRVPAFYGMGGARYALSTGRVRPYLEGALGFARLSFDVVSAEVGGIDFSDLVEEAADADDETKALLVLGGGINVPVNATFSVDIGYRWNGIFTEDPMIKASEIYGGARITF